MRILVSEIEYAIMFLYRLKLVDYKSRMRTRLINILTERLQQYKSEYLELVKEHSNLDENGNPIILVEGELQRYDIKEVNAFNNALYPLLNEEFVIEVDDNSRKIFKSVADSVLNCGLEFEGDEQFKYFRLADIFDNIDLEDEKSED